ncbi:MAG TPA: glycosyltransferase family 2 protein [Pyrinomonadaceae bacterium]|nr:glycosyltransferase family 2 protein [Pyrinomonadaceae bacterium]
MLISVCIPQYNRSRYLLVVLESVRLQDHPEVEVIISDDSSSDDTSEIIPHFITSVEGKTHIRFKYIRQPKNLGYDGNLRAALAAAHGEYLFVLGNDDALPEKDTLSKLAAILTRLNYPDIAFTNYHLAGKPNDVQRRARSTTVIGSGPDVAVKNFRAFSFVGGLVIKRTAFNEHNTDQYDGSVYVQIYLAARTIAAGGTVAAISESLVAKDVRFPGEEIDSYLDTLVRNNRRLHRELGGLDQVGRVGCEAILPYVPLVSRQRYILKIYAQLLLLTYPYWLLNYRENGVYRAAVNLALGCFPPNLIRTSNVSLLVYLCLIVLYVGSTAVGLLVPVKLLRRVAKWALYFSKRQSRHGRILKAGVELPAS